MANKERISILMKNLQKLSPMPKDEELISEEALLKEYQEVVMELYENSSLITSDNIPDLLNAFGLGTGFGLYWNLLHILEQFPWGVLEPKLISALDNNNPGTRMWALTILGRGKSKTALPAIEGLLNDPESMVRVEAILSLGMIGGPKMIPVINRMSQDPSEEVRAAAEEILERASF